MRKTLALAMFIFAVSAAAADFPPSELSIGGVASGASEASITSQLGNPSKRVDTGEGIELHYPGLIVTLGWLEQGAVRGHRRALALLGTGLSACTPRGLCPGMAASEVSRLYGPAVFVQRESGVFLEYQPEGIACWLQVWAPRVIVESVAVACQP